MRIGLTVMSTKEHEIACHLLNDMKNITYAPLQRLALAHGRIPS